MIQYREMSEEFEDVDKIIRVETLLNARLHEGNPIVKPIMGKILGKHADLRPKAKEIMQRIEEEVKKVRGMSLEEISAELSNLAPKAVKKHKEKKEKQAEKRRQQKKDLPELENVERGNFRVRYAPDPSKYPHLGQGINYLINRIYADKYDGEVILRFDDTNPTIVKEKYYDAIKSGLNWLGAGWDKEIRASQFLNEFYDQAKDMISMNKFYVCFCTGKELSEHRNIGNACKHRNFNNKENLEYFEKMISGEYDPGDAIVRLHGDMTSDNMVMRDPIMLRLVSDQHPMLDTFYPVFPTYDYESSYLEYKMNITHVIRSGEFGTMREELQSHLIELFGGKVPEFVQFGRVNIQGCPTKGRVIRELVENNVVNGWDDIRLITLQGLQNRGIHPDTPRIIVQEAGLSPQNTQIAWSTIEAKSRQLLEPESKRFYFVEKPVKITVTSVEPAKITFPFHPDHKKWGKRTFDISNTFFISSNDAEKYSVGDIFRLKDLFNIELTEEGNELKGIYRGEELIDNTDKIQWVTADYVQGTLTVPLTLEDEKGEIRENSMLEISGYFENNITTIDQFEVVQLERTGFAKLRYKGSEVEGHMVHQY